MKTEEAVLAPQTRLMARLRQPPGRRLGRTLVQKLWQRLIQRLAQTLGQGPGQTL